MGTLPCPAEDEEEKDLDLVYGDDKDADDCQGFEKYALENPSININLFLFLLLFLKRAVSRKYS